MTKRILCVFLCVFLCFSICACSNLKNAKAAEKVGQLIADIGVVSIDSGEKIKAARTEYDALPEEAQALVTNLSELTAAEKEYEFVCKLDANTIKNYKTINAKKANTFEMTTDTWYDNAAASATLFLCFQLQGITDNQVVVDDLDMLQQYICICKEDNRVDIYAPYAEGQVMGIQYWPDKGTAQIGVVKTELSIDEYLQLLVDGDVIDKHKNIPLSDIVEIMNLIS